MLSSEAPHSLERGGLLNINKPSGLGSFRVVQGVREILKEKKVGHCGTLDPMAEGVLLVLFGRATTYSSALMDGDKVYAAEMRLGIKTDTGDRTGKVLEVLNPPPVDVFSVKRIFEKFIGEIEQVSPAYSSVKWKGRRLYQYAREGIEVFRPPRKVTISSIQLDELVTPLIRFRLTCSKGTYVRSLVEDIGHALGTVATLDGLTRERSGSYSIDTSLTWNKVCQLNREELLSESLLPVVL